MIKTDEIILDAEKAAMDWLIYAAQKKRNKGIPHSRWLLIPEALSWKPSYPETSGYLIENLLVRNVYNSELQQNIANQIGEWLLEQQSPTGYFYAGLKKTKASVFNTAQILGGLHLLNNRNQSEKYCDRITKAHNWFLSQISPEGVWQSGLYVDSWFPVYYAHALWKYIKIDLDYFDGHNLPLLTNSYFHFLSKAQLDIFANSSFYPHKACTSHTLAYSMEGLLACAKLLKDDLGIQWIYEKLLFLSERSLAGQQFPAAIHSDTEWDNSFICTTGHAQFTSLYYQVSAELNESWALDTAEQLLHVLLNIQFKSHDPAMNGAFPASYPIWKPYFPFRIVNWTQKFFLDACWRRRELIGRC